MVNIEQVINDDSYQFPIGFMKQRNLFASGLHIDDYMSLIDPDYPVD
jgi:hypothetical protein